MEEMVKNKVTETEISEKENSFIVNENDETQSEKNEQNMTGSKNKKIRILKYLPSILCILCGLVVFITGVIGIFTYNKPSTTRTSYEYYGGDAYTGMQQASADASNNAKEAARQVYNLIKCINTLTIFLGIFMLIFGLIKIVETSLKIEVIDNTEANIYYQIEKDTENN